MIYIQEEDVVKITTQEQYAAIVQAAILAARLTLDEQYREVERTPSAEVRALIDLTLEHAETEMLSWDIEDAKRYLLGEQRPKSIDELEEEYAFITALSEDLYGQKCSPFN